MFFALIGLFWIVAVFPNAKRIQISQRFQGKKENARIVSMIDFVLEQKYKKASLVIPKAEMLLLSYAFSITPASPLTAEAPSASHS